jgi:hypothetical protein
MTDRRRLNIIYHMICDSEKAELRENLPKVFIQHLSILQIRVEDNRFERMAMTFKKFPITFIWTCKNRYVSEGWETAFG